MIPRIPGDDPDARHPEHRGAVQTTPRSDHFVIGGLAVGIVGLTIGDALLAVTGLAAAVAMIQPRPDDKSPSHWPG